jgi:hypothetical protein
MTTLSEMTLLVSRLLQTTYESSEDDGGGSTTQLIDSTIPFGDGMFDDGTIWFTSGDNDGVSRVITAWDQSTTEFTFAALSNNVGSGDSYAAAKSDYPRWLLVQAVNLALQAIGDVEAFDTSLTTVANQESYSLPTGVRNILALEIAQSTSSPYRYEEFPPGTWKERGGSIYFRDYNEPGSDDYTIRLRYLSSHATLEDDTDTVDAEIHDNVVKYHAAVEAMKWRKQKGASIDKDLMGMYMRQAKEALQAHPPPAMRHDRAPSMGIWGAF